MPHDITGFREELDHPNSRSAAGASESVPISEPLPDTSETNASLAAIANSLSATSQSNPASATGTGATINPFPIPPFHICNIDLREGCYRIRFTPNRGFNRYDGTLRVDKSGGQTTISGDLYRFSTLSFPITTDNGITATRPSVTSPIIFPPIFPLPLNIPIYPRNRYYSYLKVTGVETSPIITTGPCFLTLTAQEYVYTKPSAGSFNGSFPASPGTRTVTIRLSPATAPSGFSGPYFEGRLFEGAVDRGSFTMGWVSKYFRRARVEVDTLTGAIAPQPVPAISGGGMEDIRTVFATAGWDVFVKYDQKNLPVPAGVTANNCWSSNNLHALMLSVRDPATNLDTEWRMHLVVVPAKLGCGRGVMYDTIGTPREGVASFSHDGYPTGNSSNFGTAANKMQHQVPRAFLRSACHEIGHGFNQIHQEQEGGADNSIMTTTPSVANVLGGPASGAPGVFPDNINLGFNGHVRRHLAHFPDIVVRPGGMTFGTGHSSTVPQADQERVYLSDDELELRLSVEHDRIHLGEPLQLRWKLTNKSASPLPAPTDVRIEAQHTLISVINPHGDSKAMASFVIETEAATIGMLAPGKSVKAATRVFWSARSGFAFDTPGRYTIEVRTVWGIAGVPVGVKASATVWVNYPQCEADNQLAASLLHQEVGMFVALGGGAKHLKEAVSRLETCMASSGGDQSEKCAMRGYQGLI
ncbi:MAG: hypothetical protein ACU843_15545 [Gammaproteobacteria bacterium]